jgi:integrase
METWGDTPIKQITDTDVSNLLEALKKKKYSKKVITTQFNVLNMIFNHEIKKKEGCIMFNPCDKAKMPKGLTTTKRQLPSDEDIEKIKNSDWLFPFFLFYTGCRRGEALALTYEDIDWDKKIIHINKSVGYKGNEPYIKMPKTEAGYRDIILLDKLAERIPKKKQGLIFPDGEGKIYHESVLTRKWQRWAKNNDINCTPHQLRHGFATLLFEAGIEAKDAQYLLGHSTISMTQDVYTHIRNSRQLATAQKLNEYISK